MAEPKYLNLGVMQANYHNYENNFTAYTALGSFISFTIQENFYNTEKSYLISKNDKP